MKRKTSADIITFLYAVITAAVVLLICSKSSPLYPLNDWVDANTFLTIGRGSLHGRVPYRDLYEQKGPVLYFIHTLAAWITEDSFLGVWLTEIAAASAFLFETALLFRNNCGKYRIWGIPVIAVMVYASQAFCHGDSAEELCLPLTMGAYMAGHRAVAGKESASGREWLLLGVLAGAVLWIKFTFLGIFAAAIAAMTVTCKKGMLLRNYALGIIGAAAVSVPVLVYYAVKSALDDLFSVYFYDNLFRYGSGDGFSFRHITDGLNFARVFMGAVFWTVCVGILIMLVRKKYRLSAYFAASLIIMSLTVFGGHGSYQYYPLAMAVFLPQAADEIISAAEEYFHKRGMKSPGRVYILCIMFSLLASVGISFKTSRNVYMLGQSKAELPQYQFAEYIASRGGGSLLNYGFIDGGFYLAAGQVPEFRYFCMNNMDVPEMKAAQEYYISSGKADYVVVRSESPDTEFSFPGYELAVRGELAYYDKYFYYFLFEFNEKSIKS